MHTVLVSCVGKANKPNVTTGRMGYADINQPAPISHQLAPTRHTHTLIEEIRGEFIVNIPTMEILQAVYSCGSITGRSFDKFKKANLTQNAWQKG